MVLTPSLSPKALIEIEVKMKRKEHHHLTKKRKRKSNRPRGLSSRIIPPAQHGPVTCVCTAKPPMENTKRQVHRCSGCITSGRQVLRYQITCSCSLEFHVQVEVSILSSGFQNICLAPRRLQEHWQHIKYQVNKLEPYYLKGLSPGPSDILHYPLRKGKGQLTS